MAMTTPDPAMGERARALVDGVAEQVWPTDLSTRAQTLLVVAIAAFAAEVASARHYVCEAHVPLGEPGNHDDACPCCAAMRVADQTQGQLAATERATATAGKWLRAYQDAYGKL